MIKSKKILSLIIAGVLGISMLTGCSKNDGSNASNENKKTDIKNQKYRY